MIMIMSSEREIPISAQGRNKMKANKAVTVIVLLAVVAVTGSCAKENVVSRTSDERKNESIPFSRVHFPFDKDEMFLKEMDQLASNAEWLKKNKDAVVILEGHCDEHGPSGYNMELGDRRARTVKAHLIENGVPHDRIIMVVSYGEKRPADPTHNFDAWKMNRRVEFILR